MTKKQIDDLLKDGKFDDQPIKGRLIETHISWVILTKKFAFKIKKPMRFSFLDFSTLKKRKHYCHRELKLNQPLAEEMYLDVLPIKQLNNQMIMGGQEGKTIEYALLMKRMQNAKEMDVLLKKGQVAESDLHRLAEKIARFHINADRIEARPDIKEMEADYNDLLSIKDFVAGNAGKHWVEIITSSILHNKAFLKRHGTLIKQRAGNGFVRYCHGDFHSRNIFLYKDPVIFDCIEFNDHFKQIDVLNEIAFFCMDLEAFGRDDLSRAFLSAYLKLFPCAGTKEEKQLFIYYKSYRANIRAKVNALRGKQAKDQAAKYKHLEEVKKYLQLMERYWAELNEASP